MLSELQTKGGGDQFGERGFSVQRGQQSTLGKRVLRDTDPTPFQFRTGDSRYQTAFDNTDYISETGYLPQKLLDRGFNRMEHDMAHAMKLPLAMVKKRPKPFMIDKRLDVQVDEYYRKVVRPRQTLLDSENIALQQLKAAHGISSTSMRQLPMTNDKNDSMYDTMKTLMMQSDMLRSVGNKHKAIGDNNSGYDDDPFDGNGRPNYSAINFNNFDWDGNYVGRFGGNDDNEEGGGGDDNQDEERKQYKYNSKDPSSFDNSSFISQTPNVKSLVTPGNESRNKEGSTQQQTEMIRRQQPIGKTTRQFTLDDNDGNGNMRVPMVDNDERRVQNIAEPDPATQPQPKYKYNSKDPTPEQSFHEANPGDKSSSSSSSDDPGVPPGGGGGGNKVGRIIPASLQTPSKPPGPGFIASLGGFFQGVRNVAQSFGNQEEQKVPIINDDMMEDEEATEEAGQVETRIKQVGGDKTAQKAQFEKVFDKYYKATKGLYIDNGSADNLDDSADIDLRKTALEETLRDKSIAAMYKDRTVSVLKGAEQSADSILKWDKEAGDKGFFKNIDPDKPFIYRRHKVHGKTATTDDIIKQVKDDFIIAKLREYFPWADFEVSYEHGTYAQTLLDSMQKVKPIPVPKVDPNRDEPVVRGIAAKVDNERNARSKGPVRQGISGDGSGTNKPGDDPEDQSNPLFRGHTTIKRSQTKATRPITQNAQQNKLIASALNTGPAGNTRSKARANPNK